MNESNAFPNGLPYAAVSLSYIYDGAKRGVQITVQADERILDPCKNFGIRRFGFNTTIQEPAENLSITLPSIWIRRFVRPVRGLFGWFQSTLFNYSAFGRFEIDTRTGGRGRVNPLVIEIYHVTDNLSLTDFSVPNDDGYMFSTHIADYTFNDSLCTSGYFSAREQLISTTTTSLKVTTTTVPKTTTTAPVTTSVAVTTTAPVTTSTSVTTSVAVTTTLPTTTSVPVSTTSSVTTTVPATTTAPVTTTLPTTTSVPVSTTSSVTTTVPVTTTLPVTTSVPTTTTTIPPQQIPTLSEWGTIIFMTIIMGIGVVFIMRRRSL